MHSLPLVMPGLGVLGVKKSVFPGPRVPPASVTYITTVLHSFVKDMENTAGAHGTQGPSHLLHDLKPQPPLPGPSSRVTFPQLDPA